MAISSTSSSTVGGGTGEKVQPGGGFGNILRNIHQSVCHPMTTGSGFHKATCLLADLSGNQTTAAATVLVPQNQEKGRQRRSAP